MTGSVVVLASVDVVMVALWSIVLYSCLNGSFYYAAKVFFFFFWQSAWYDGLVEEVGLMEGIELRVDNSRVRTGIWIDGVVDDEGLETQDAGR